MSVKPTLDPESPSTTHTLSGEISARILYVENDEAIRRSYGEVLLGAGYGVDLAANGELGWDALKRKDYDLLIADHRMPRLTGVELAVRARRAGFALPIVIASGCATFAEDDAYAWLRLSSLRKPFTAAALLETVVGILRATQPTAPEVTSAISQTALVASPSSTQFIKR